MITKESQDRAVTPGRAARLYRLLHILGKKPTTRSDITRRLRLEIRGFYRDLNLLREAGIHVVLDDSRYALNIPLAVAIARLPFPDPKLTLGEARQLAKGRGVVCRKLKKLVQFIIKK